MTSNKLSLEIKDLHFAYQDPKVLQNINLNVEERETVALIGPSGFGKTTLLQLIAGDLSPQTGSIKKLGLWRRVFQSNALFPWLTVEENIKLGLRGIEKNRQLDFDQLVNLLDLKRVLNFYPRQLSGGLRQRTEIARALIGKPDGLLLDEPFSSLDYMIRHETRNYLAELLKEFPMTMILVTHDIPEAVSLAKKIYVLKGTPATISRVYDNQLHQQTLTDQIWKDLHHEKI